MVHVLAVLRTKVAVDFMLGSGAEKIFARTQIDIHCQKADAVVSVASHEKHDSCIRMTRRGFDSSRKSGSGALRPARDGEGRRTKLEKCTKFAFFPGRSHSLHFCFAGIV